jgi:hypothetical protein
MKKWKLLVIALLAITLAPVFAGGSGEKTEVAKTVPRSLCPREGTSRL